ncbi:ribokinase [Iamia sp. SCSIO 61187]|nr:ribokinase [Iamia sp. SCSIO 61187]
MLVVGDLLVDVVAVPDGPLRPGSDTAARVRLTGGGSAANTACWLADRGTAVALLAAVGDDALGAAARHDLAAAGVELVGPVLTGVATGTCVVIVAPDGERTMLPDRGANDALPAAAVAAALTDDVGWVHVSGYALLHEGSRAAGVEALAAARAQGVRTSVDAASSGPLRDLGAARARDLMAGIDVLFANADELAALGGIGAVRGHVGAVVLKEGAGGASWIGAGPAITLPAAPAEVVDTTGAGDALAAGALAALVAGADAAGALAAGVAVAARAVAQVGARPPLPTTRPGPPDP